MQAYLFSHIFVWHLGGVVMLASGSILACNGSITPAQLVAFVMYSDHAITAAMAVCEQLVDVGQNLGTVDKVLR
jgi:ABC-type bacteriocin/lantibiotic exporter with double-glycine peptidase domain